ncbi:LysR family transcriptional regulator [Olsenella sp. SW781]|nr:LysR family transcriptional regulator [Olsenella sp. SW781]
MTIEQLEHIACVARTGSISRAAAELHMSQPALQPRSGASRSSW